MRRLCETAVILIGTLGWWGFVYPDLCLTQEAYEQEAETQEDGDMALQNQESESKSIWKSGVKVGELRIKSRAAEYVYQVKEKETTEKELEYD